jgi:signal transduction histidine kinase
MNPFRPPIAALRWGAVAIGLVLAAPAGHGLQPRVLLGALVLVAYALVRTYRPIALHQGSLRLASLAEAAVHLAVVAATGYWESPFVVSLLSAVIVVGFARGFSAALRIAAASALALALPYHLTTTSGWDEALALTMQWTSELLLVAAVAGYARRFSVEAAERHDRDVDRLDRLAEANTLLHSLHDVAQSLPTSLDLDEALDSVVTRVRTLCDARSLVIVLPDEAGSGWLVARQSGSRLPNSLVELPPALDAAWRDPTRVRRIDLDAGAGLAPRSCAALYVTLTARDEVVGLLALEHDQTRAFSPPEVGLVTAFAETAGLAVDNARRFGRLRTSSVDEERSRIAGELHDRVGQSLACMAFEIDHLVRHRADEELRGGLERLRTDLRSVIGEIRDTLSDLRTEVTENRGLVETVEAFLDRVNQRSGHKALFHHCDSVRLPLLKEQVMWRVLSEWVNQSLRRGDCAVEVWWSCDAAHAELEVTTDFTGPDLGGDEQPGPWADALRHHAAGIGATLEIEGLADGVSRLRCSLVLP